MGILVCVWFFVKDKGKCVGEVFFIDVCNFGYMVDCVECIFSNDDIIKIVGMFYVWMGVELNDVFVEYVDVLGFVYLVLFVEIKIVDYVLMFGCYVGIFEVEDDGVVIEDKF